MNANWQALPIRPFDETAALEQLRQELETKTTAEHARLARALGYLPLALHLAAGHLRAGRRVDGFLKLLKRRGLELEPDDPADHGLTTDRSRALLSTTFELSLELLREQLAEEADALLSGLYALGHAPATGFGQSLGATLAELEADDFEELSVQAFKLSLLERVPETPPEQPRWRLHPLLAELLRGRSDGNMVLGRMSDWFIDRLPKRDSGQEDEQGRRWREVNDEHSALAEWLALVPETDQVRAERAGSWYAMHNGPFQAWAALCEQALENDPADNEKSNFLWTLCQVARRSGALDRALEVAQTKAALDQQREDERETALAQGVIADILQARGELDEALRIRQEEQLPVYERLGDVRSRAVTMGQIADILQARGELDEALRIRQEEQLPVYERLNSVHDMLIGRAKIGILLLNRNNSGDRKQAAKYLFLALKDAQRLRLPEANIISQIIADANLEE
jgi:tetratricopeptide (TPR) repeat protein